jgi:hypothetical protein
MTTGASPPICTEPTWIALVFFLSIALSVLMVKLSGYLRYASCKVAEKR